MTLLQTISFLVFVFVSGYAITRLIFHITKIWLIPDFPPEVVIEPTTPDDPIQIRSMVSPRYDQIQRDRKRRRKGNGR